VIVRQRRWVNFSLGRRPRNPIDQKTKALKARFNRADIFRRKDESRFQRYGPRLIS